jgi:prepilin-type N-terminal cleavage/methylation domain-containing protein
MTIHPRRQTPRRGRAGFSLLELVMVIAVLTVIMVIAQPRVAEALQRQRLRGAAERVATDLKFARGEAMRLRTYTLVVFDPVNDRYAAWYIDAATDPPAWAVMTDPLVPTRRLTVDLGSHPDHAVDIMVANFEGVPAVAFDPYGAAIQGGGISLGLGRLQIDAKVDVTSGSVEMSDMLSTTDLAAPRRSESTSLDGISPGDVGVDGTSKAEPPVDGGKEETPVDEKGEIVKSEEPAAAPTSEGLVTALLRGLLGG